MGESEGGGRVDGGRKTPAALPWAGRRIWLRPAARCDRLDDGRTVVWLGGSRQVIGGRSARIVPPLLARLREGAVADEVVEALCRGGGFDPREVHGVIGALWERGLLDEAERPEGDDLPAELAAQLRYLSLFTARPRAAASRIACARVRVVAFAALGRRLEAGLRRSGVGSVEVLDERAPAPPAAPAPAATAGGEGGEAGDPPWTALGGRSLEEPWMLRWNDALVARGGRFLACAIQGASALIGPSVLPRESACLRCAVEAERRLRSSRPAEPGAPIVPPSPCEPVALLDLAADLVVLELVKELAGVFGSSLAGRALVVEPAASQIELRPVLKLPRCPSCGRPATRAEVEAFPAPRPPARPAGGGAEAGDAA